MELVCESESDDVNVLDLELESDRVWEPEWVSDQDSERVSDAEYDMDTVPVRVPPGRVGVRVAEKVLVLVEETVRELETLPE